MLTKSIISDWSNGDYAICAMTRLGMTCTASGCQTLPLVEPLWTLQLFTVLAMAEGSYEIAIAVVFQSRLTTRIYPDAENQVWVK